MGRVIHTGTIKRLHIMALFALQQWHQLNLLVDFWCISKLSGGTCYCPIRPVTAPKFSQGLRLPSVMHIRWAVVILTRHSN